MIAHYCSDTGPFLLRVQKIEQFKEESPHCMQCGFLLMTEQAPIVKHFGLQLIEHYVKLVPFSYLYILLVFLDLSSLVFVIIPLFSLLYCSSFHCLSYLPLHGL